VGERGAEGGLFSLTRRELSFKIINNSEIEEFFPLLLESIMVSSNNHG